MMLALVVVLAAAPKTDAKLVGTWLLGNAPFITFKADGTATMEDDRVKWSADGKTLKVVDEDGETDTASYRVDGDVLTMTLGGTPLQLQRAGSKPEGGGSWGCARGTTSVHGRVSQSPNTRRAAAIAFVGSAASASSSRRGDAAASSNRSLTR